MKRNWKIILLTGTVLLVVILLAVNLYNSGKKEVLAQFREQQFIHAQHITIQIESFLLYHSWRLQELSRSIVRHYGDMGKKKFDIQGDLESFRKQMEKAHVKGILLQDRNSAIINSSDSNMSRIIEGQTEFLAWARKKENRGRVSVWPMSLPPPLRLLLAIPLYRETPNRGQRSKTGGKFAGVLSLTVDLKEFLADQLVLSASNANLHQVWIVDREGRLLFHSEHQEMVSRNILQRDESCNQCHFSFDYAEKMLKEGHGFGEYKVRNGPEKLAAFAPLKFENAAWIVVVDSPLDEVTAFTWKSLKGYMILLGIVIVAFIGGSTLIIRNDRLKVKAEEEMRHWREKRSLEDKVRESEELFRTIIETAHDKIWTLNHLGNFTFMNKRGKEIFGYKASEWRGENITQVVHPEDWAKVQERWLNISKVESYSCELRINAKDGQILILSVNVAPLYKNEKIIGTVWFGRDITEHRQAQKALQESEWRYRTLVETMNDGLVVISENGLLTYVNDQVCQRSGYSKDELIGRPVTVFLDETGKNILKEQMSKRIRGEHEAYEIPAIGKDGRKIFVLISPKPIFDENGHFKSSFAVITDITKQKRVEEALRESEKQLRHLSSQLLTAQETERRRISRELHDELGQALTLMKIRLRPIEEKLRKDQGAIRRECQNILQYIDQIIENVRRLSRDLSPSILEDLGLTAALRWLIDTFIKNDSIKVSVNIADIDNFFSQDQQIIIYRIAQEALTNIGKHAGAKNVSLVTQIDDTRVFLCIEDDGEGFDVARATMEEPSERGLGLAIMDERARMLGGSLEIWSQKGKGARITLSIPIDRKGSL
jgi:PAS domain S-box-containing protein